MTQKYISRRKALKNISGISLFLVGGGLSLIVKPTVKVVDKTPEVNSAPEIQYEEEWYYMRMSEGCWA
jgi:putative NADH-flavin reductase